MKDEKIKLEADLINLSKARNFISKKAKEAGADESDITKIEISCDEWCANIIEHSLSSDEHLGFSIECRSEEGKFIIIYENVGERFNPIEQDAVDLNDHFSQSKERGLGIYIMKEMMDEIHYEYVENKINKLTLVKYMNTG
jgi:serine/threonine-protein kinase RsbW